MARGRCAGMSDFAARQAQLCDADVARWTAQISRCGRHVSVTPCHTRGRNVAPIVTRRTARHPWRAHGRSERTAPRGDGFRDRAAKCRSGRRLARTLRRRGRRRGPVAAPFPAGEGRGNDDHGDAPRRAAARLGRPVEEHDAGREGAARVGLGRGGDGRGRRRPAGDRARSTPAARGRCPLRATLRAHPPRDPEPDRSTRLRHLHPVLRLPRARLRPARRDPHSPRLRPPPLRAPDRRASSRRPHASADPGARGGGPPAGRERSLGRPPAHARCAGSSPRPPRAAAGSARPPRRPAAPARSRSPRPSSTARCSSSSRASAACSPATGSAARAPLEPLGARVPAEPLGPLARAVLERPGRPQERRLGRGTPAPQAGARSSPSRSIVDAVAASQWIAAEVLAHDGDHPRALACLAQARAAFQRQGNRWGLGQTWLAEARVLVASRPRGRRRRGGPPGVDGRFRPGTSPPSSSPGARSRAGDLDEAEAMLRAVEGPAAERVRSLVGGDAGADRERRPTRASSCASPTARRRRAASARSSGSRTPRPRFLQAREALAWMLLKTGRYAEASTLFRGLLAQQLTPADRASVMLGLGCIAHAQQTGKSADVAPPRGGGRGRSDDRARRGAPPRAPRPRHRPALGLRARSRAQLAARGRRRRVLRPAERLLAAGRRRVRAERAAHGAARVQLGERHRRGPLQGGADHRRDLAGDPAARRAARARAQDLDASRCAR